MTISYADQSPQGLTFKILLAFLVDKIAARNCPSLDDTWQGNRAKGGEFQVVGGAEREVGVKFEIPNTIGPQV